MVVFFVVVVELLVVAEVVRVVGMAELKRIMASGLVVLLFVAVLLLPASDGILNVSSGVSCVSV